MPTCDTTPTIPQQVSCERCQTPLGACTARAFVPAGSMVAVTSKTRLRCPTCKWSRTWKPTEVEGENAA